MASRRISVLVGVIAFGVMLLGGGRSAAAECIFNATDTVTVKALFAVRGSCGDPEDIEKPPAEYHAPAITPDDATLILPPKPKDPYSAGQINVVAASEETTTPSPSISSFVLTTTAPNAGYYSDTVNTYSKLTVSSAPAVSF